MWWSPWVLLVDLDSVKIDEKIKLKATKLREECKSLLNQSKAVTDKWKIINNTVVILQTDKIKNDEIMVQYKKTMLKLQKLLSPWHGKLSR
jgi:hypothetical protein